MGGGVEPGAELPGVAGGVAVGVWVGGELLGGCGPAGADCGAVGGGVAAASHPLPAAAASICPAACTPDVVPPIVSP